MRRLVLWGALVALLAPLAHACPMCRAAAAAQDAAFLRGWNASVLFLLALVPGVLGALCCAARRAQRRDGRAPEVDGRPRWPSEVER